MTVWEPDLKLHLREDQIFATYDDETEVFHAPSFDGAIKKISSELIGAMNIVLSAHASARERSNAEALVQQQGELLYEEVFGLNGSQGRRLEDVLVLCFANAAPDTPPAITTEGAWYLLPWELMRVPASVCGRDADAYLGEMAIVAGLLGSQRILNGQSFEAAHPLQIVSFAGAGLAHADDEVKFVRSLGGPHIATPRVVERLNGNNRPSGRKRNCQTIKTIVAGPKPAEFLHGAFHSETDVQNDAFEMVLHQKARVSSRDFSASRLRAVDTSNIAFFNTCQGLSLRPWHGGGLAAHALRQWKSDLVVASLCKIDDRAAARFSQTFLQRILPIAAHQGARIGEALFEARAAALHEANPADRLIGMSFRLLGWPNMRIVVASQEAA
ncbi:MAG TPA: CHAT domain-containing protein [Verrucomicrobiae bacterium]|nr:CHAT domain-containing protein [Verrucomicrobiae bacterium]